MLGSRNVAAVGPSSPAADSTFQGQSQSGEPLAECIDVFFGHRQCRGAEALGNQAPRAGPLQDAVGQVGRRQVDDQMAAQLRRTLPTPG